MKMGIVKICSCKKNLEVLLVDLPREEVVEGQRKKKRKIRKDKEKKIRRNGMLEEGRNFSRG